MSSVLIGFTILLWNAPRRQNQCEAGTPLLQGHFVEPASQNALQGEYCSPVRIEVRLFPGFRPNPEVGVDGERSGPEIYKSRPQIQRDCDSPDTRRVSLRPVRVN